MPFKGEQLEKKDKKKKQLGNPEERPVLLPDHSQMNISTEVDDLVTLANSSMTQPPNDGNYSIATTAALTTTEVVTIINENC